MEEKESNEVNSKEENEGLILHFRQFPIKQQFRHKYTHKLLTQCQTKGCLRLDLLFKLSRKMLSFYSNIILLFFIARRSMTDSEQKERSGGIQPTLHSDKRNSDVSQSLMASQRSVIVGWYTYLKEMSLITRELINSRILVQWPFGDLQQNLNNTRRKAVNKTRKVIYWRQLANNFLESTMFTNIKYNYKLSNKNQTIYS